MISLRWPGRKTTDESVPRLPAIRRCPGCTYNFWTGRGRRSCNWLDCPYLPEEYKVFCPQCNFNFLTHEGNPKCGDPPSCASVEEGYRRAESVHRYLHERHNPR